MTWALRAAAISAVVAIYALRLDHAAGLIVDDAWYVLLAKAIAQGEGYRLISSAVTPIMPVVPPGFPLLLAPVFLVSPQFPDNVQLLKVVSIAAMLGVGAAFFHHLVRQRGTPPAQAAALALATVLIPGFVFLATSTVMSECVFTLAQVLTVVLLERSGRAAGRADHVRVAALAGAMASAAVLTRTAGVAMLLAGALYLLKDRAWRRLAAFSAAALLCLAPWVAYSAAHAPTAAQIAEHGGSIAYSYSNWFSMRRAGDGAAGRTSAGDLPARVARNTVNVFGRDVGGLIVPAFFRGPDESGQEVIALGGATGFLGAGMGSAPVTMVVSFIVSAIGLVGFVVRARQGVTSAEILVAVSLAMILLVPARTFRYVLPLAPFLWMYFADGLRTVAAGRDTLVRIALACLIVLQLQEHAQYVVLKIQNAPAPDWLADQREVDDLLSWMRTNLADDDGVATTNPGLVFLHTGRKTVASEDPAHNWKRWRASGIRYLVSLRTIPAPSRALGFTKLYDSPRHRLFVIELADP